ncbi:hypothetical protein CBP51_08760 [Cellvibrio mixtus]|uniref:Solute-binding protein family 3/N-terminal domain-containing protein n=1 Tax=Cellvibrio mixtus TaxID=39650 RepID=A0A266QCI2_9GAMM|nr:hypothetical protein [Cellvibrio mixtus]OZY87059.1 hypothetical protein CBP51_08760 [Cellvibrio mixtus]
MKHLTVYHPERPSLAIGILWRRLSLLSRCAVLLLLATPALAGQPVIYSWAESRSADERGHYPVALLKLALAKAGGTYEPKASSHDMSQSRTLRHVELGRDLDITWTLTTPEREQRLLPIRIPIDRGLLGWRLLLITPQDSDFFATLTAGQLKNLRSGQEQDWPDYQILRHNGFKITPATNYQGLFYMLKRGRIAYFPRALTEVLPEIHAQKNIDLAIAPRWVLYYPAPVYFFVNKQRPELAAAIEKGLLMAIDDGSMHQLFITHFGESINRMELHKREIIRLENPLLPAETPLDNAALWYDATRGF